MMWFFLVFVAIGVALLLGGVWLGVQIERLTRK